MTATAMPGPSLTLGGFLRDRRGRLTPAPAVQSRRRTPGLRREEVASRVAVSVTWYTWLEQGRGGQWRRLWREDRKRRQLDSRLSPALTAAMVQPTIRAQQHQKRQVLAASVRAVCSG